MVLLIDNYDSFTYNIYEYLKILGAVVKVYKNDDDTVFELDFKDVSHIIISPGPGRPEDARNSLKILERYTGRIPILGVCLGHQCINYLHGGSLFKGNPVHGVVEPIRHSGTGIFRGLKNPLKVTRYHSLSIDESTLSPELAVTSRLADGTIMSIENSGKLLYGVQFHPEAILTEQGLDLFKNFLRINHEKND